MLAVCTIFLKKIIRLMYPWFKKGCLEKPLLLAATRASLLVVAASGEGLL